MQLNTNENDIGLKHFNWKFRNTTKQWAGSDQLELFNENLKDPVKKEILTLAGFLPPDCISYKYNNYGFRDEEFDNRPAGIALGCSFTEGTGLPASAIWCSVLSKLIGTHIWNLGVGSSSLDTVFRLLDYWLPRLSPKFVVICVPPEFRVELFNNDLPLNIGVWSESPFSEYYKLWIDSSANDIISKRKNLLAIQQLCDNTNTILRFLSWSDMRKESQDRITLRTARDLQHFGARFHVDFAQKMYNLLPKEITQ
jgi:hypothetical protein